MNIRILFIALVSLLFSAAAHSQSLTFCDRVDANGKAVNAASSFAMVKNGRPVTLLYSFPAGAKPANVNFDLYKINGTGEVFQSTMKQRVDPSKNYVAKQVIFYDAGKYRIYVFDEADKQLTKGELIMK